MPDEKHEVFWRLASGPLADVSSDLLGGNVTFNHSKLNFKWGKGRDGWGWHQDNQHFPYTNYRVMSIATYLKDTAAEDGALAVVPRSHHWPLFDLYGNGGQWTGQLSLQDAALIDGEDFPDETGSSAPFSA